VPVRPGDSSQIKLQVKKGCSAPALECLQSVGGEVLPFLIALAFCGCAALFAEKLASSTVVNIPVRLGRGLPPQRAASRQKFKNTLSEKQASPQIDGQARTERTREP